MHVIICICVCQFRDEIRLRGEECKTREKLNFSEKWKNSDLSIQYRLKTYKSSISRMMKHTSPLDFPHEI